MSETERIWDLLQRSFEGGEAWRCPSLRDLLGAASAAQAAARPIAGAPTIWELVLHLTVYEQVVCRRLAGEAVDLDGAAGWPVPRDASPEAWLAAKLGYGEARRALRQAVAAFPAARFNETVPGREYPFYVLVHGAIDHAVYHAGQVETLLIAQGARTSASPFAMRESPPPAPL